MFTHVVLFWLNDNTPEPARQQIINDCQTHLAKIPTVKQLHVGRPAMTPRQVVDNSYHVGLCVILDDSAAHDVYQDHPLHKQFIARNQSTWKRVQVYDFK
jgi:hypothetical protein